MKNLLVDIGNSRIKFAVTDSASVSDLPPYWALAHQNFAADFSRLVATETLLKGVQKIMWCSVASAAQTEAVIAALNQHYPAIAAWRFTGETPVKNFINAYQTPATLGADRWAAAIGARAHQAHGALLIAALGTATTLDVLSADNQFLGGVILPGVSAMTSALQQQTQLPAQSPQLSEALFSVSSASMPNNTSAAIHHGIFVAQLGALKQMHAYAEAFLNTPVTVLLTGGASPYLQTFLNTPLAQAPADSFTYRLVDNLVLHGLRVIATEHS